jgi:hypothetical protein
VLHVSLDRLACASCCQSWGDSGNGSSETGVELAASRGIDTYTYINASTNQALPVVQSLLALNRGETCCELSQYAQTKQARGLPPPSSALSLPCQR